MGGPSLSKGLLLLLGLPPLSPHVTAGYREGQSSKCPLRSTRRTQLGTRPLPGRLAQENSPQESGAGEKVSLGPT